jgi:hypothetical protein
MEVLTFLLRSIYICICAGFPALWAENGAGSWWIANVRT